jgi:hypothetical protein
MIYVNTVCVIESDLIIRSVGGTADLVSVLLTADEATVAQRLQTRHHGSELREHLDRGHRMARVLEEVLPQPCAA